MSMDGLPVGAVVRSPATRRGLEVGLQSGAELVAPLGQSWTEIGGADSPISGVFTH